MAASVARAPAPAPAEMAHFGAKSEKLEVIVKQKATPEAVKKAGEKAQELRAHQQKERNEDPKDFFKKLAQEQVSPLPEHQRKALEGYKENPKDTKPPPEVQRMLDFDRYMRVDNDIARGVPPAEAYKRAGFINDPKGLTAEKQYQQMRDGVMDHLLGQPVVKALIPEVDAFKSNDALKRDYVDAVIASDENVRGAIMEKGKSLAEKAGKLPQVDAVKQQEALNKINAELGLTDLSKVVELGKLDKLPGGNIVAVKDQLYTEALKANGVKDPESAKNYLRVQGEMDRKTAQKKVNLDPVVQARLDQEIGDLAPELNKWEIAAGIKNGQGEEIADVRSKIITADAKVRNVVYSQQKDINGMPLPNSMDALVNNLVTETQANTKPTPEQLQAQSEINEALAKGMNESIIKGKNETDTEARAIDARKMEADADQLEKAGKHEAAQLVTRLKIEMDEDWVNQDGRSNRDGLASDLDIYDDKRNTREDAVRRIIMGKVYIEGSQVTVVTDKGEETMTVGKDGQLMRSDGKVYSSELQIRKADGTIEKQETKMTVGNIPLGELAGKSKEQMDELYTNHGDSVEKKLLTDCEHALKHTSHKDLGGNDGLKHLKDRSNEQKQERIKKGETVLEEIARDNSQVKALLEKFKFHGMSVAGFMALLMSLSLFFKAKTGMG